MARIETADVLGTLAPIWTSKPETREPGAPAHRGGDRPCHGDAGVRTGENPARWRGHLGHLLPKPSKVRAVEHHPALAWHEVPAFLAELSGRQGVAARALAFTILTAARSGEVRGMLWSEIDRQRAIWTIPAARMKAGKEHTVPLSAAALALLAEPDDPTRLMFGSETKPGSQLSDLSMTSVLKRMGRADLTVHGFRSTFRDWAGEATTHPREVIEAALAHRLKDKAEAAYARGDLMTKRRKLMDDWAEFLVLPSARVIEFRSVRVS